MSHELLYTSAPRGLKPGSRGFCTVLSTQGMPAPLAIAVEALSGYRPLYPSNDDRASRNPVVYSHLKLQATGRTCHVLSRITDYGLDYSQRANKLAHHVILESTAERLSGGPANLLSMPGFMREEWSGEPKVVAIKPVTREPRPAHGICRQWQELTGDAGWAGVLAESFLRDPERLVILLFAPGQEILPLIAESLSLLPAEKRWDVTFSTYFTSLAPGTTCIWRAIVHDSKEAHESLRFVHALRIDLTEEGLPPATGGELVAAARSGTYAESKPRRSPPPLTRDDENSDEAESPDTIDEFHQIEQDSHNSANPRRLPPQHARPNSPIAYPVAQQAKRTGRSLADVIEEEARQPPRRKRIWIAIPVVVLLMTVLFLSTRVAVFRPELSSEKAEPEANAQAQAEKKKKAESKAKEKAAATPHVGAKAKEEAEATAPAQAEATAPAQAEATAPAPAKAKEEAKSHPGAKVERVEIPVGRKSVQLHKAERKNTDSTQKFRFFKPEWLKHTFKTNKKDQKIVEISVNATGGPETVATMKTEEVSNLSATTVTYKITGKNDDPLEWIGWCRIRFMSPNDVATVLKEIKFTDFPMDEKTVELNFKESKLLWNLPKNLPVKESEKPELELEMLKIFSEGRQKVYTLSPSSAGSAFEWELTCPDLETEIYNDLKCEIKKGGRTIIEVKIEPTTISSIPAKLAFSISGGFLKPASDRIEGRKDDLAGSFGVAFAGEDQAEVKKRLTSHINGVDINSKKYFDKKEGLLKLLRETAETLKVKVSESKDQEKEKYEQIKMEFDTGRESLNEVFKDVDDYLKVKLELSRLKITGMRLFYKLIDAEPNRSEALPDIYIDVINFDDIPQAGANP